MTENVYLTGFMGCGKTTVGTSLAAYQGKKFMDLDEELVSREKKSIAYLFEHYGEAYFRELEARLLEETKHIQGAIISMGGGIVEEERNRLFLKEKKVVYLKWDFEVLYERIKGDGKRPLVTTKEALYERYKKREKWYEEIATHVIVCSDHTPYRLAHLLIQLLKPVG